MRAIGNRIAAILLFSSIVCLPQEQVGIPGNKTASVKKTARTWEYLYNINIALILGDLKPGFAYPLNQNSQARGFLLGGEMKPRDNIVLGVQVQWQGVGDDSSYTVNTTGGEMGSLTNLYGVAFFAGYRLNSRPFREKGWRLSAGANLGWNSISGSREVSACANCGGEDLEVDGGLYFEPIIMLERGIGFGVGLSHRFYQKSSDMAGMLVIRFFGLTFNKHS